MLSFHAAVLVALVAFAIAIVLGPIAIPILRKLKVGQNVRDDGPKKHLSILDAYYVSYVFLWFYRVFGRLY
jgi:UDP-N-acetylmuramyl pentapeptide phosphotransferase/UDP-N-acetylglucosamine-1-phosphate transferase